MIHPFAKWPIAFIVFLQLLWSFVCHGQVLENNTVWQGTVRVDEEVVVAFGVTLLIEPGTRIIFARPEPEEGRGPVKLTVLGKLVAQGTAGSPILFTSAADRPEAGDWFGLVFDNNIQSVISRMRHCRVEYADTAISGSLAALVVEDCRLQHNRIALLGQKKFSGGMMNCDLVDNENGSQFVQNSGFRLENCRISRNLNDGIFCNLNSCTQISNCEITENGHAGIRCLRGGSPSVSGCLIRGNQTGIHVEMKSHPQLRGNDILANGTGIYAERLVAPMIVGNRIAENDVGVFGNLSAAPQLHKNNFEHNRRFAVVLGDEQSLVVDHLLPAGKNRRRLQKGKDLPEQRKMLAEEKVPSGKDAKTLLDARDNWWGEAATAEMTVLAGDGNVTIFEDFFDKPEVEYEEKKYPRDKVVYVPWAEQPYVSAGRQLKRYAGIDGKVVFEGQPLSGARVHIFRETSADFHGEGFCFSSPTDGDGRFSLPLVPGTYYLTVKKTTDGFPAAKPANGDLFAYYEGNPVIVEAGEDVAITLTVPETSTIR